MGNTNTSNWLMTIIFVVLTSMQTYATIITSFDPGASADESISDIVVPPNAVLKDLEYRLEFKDGPATDFIYSLDLEVRIDAFDIEEHNVFTTTAELGVDNQKSEDYFSIDLSTIGNHIHYIRVTILSSDNEDAHLVDLGGLSLRTSVHTKFTYHPSPSIPVISSVTGGENLSGSIVIDLASSNPHLSHELLMIKKLKQKEGEMYVYQSEDWRNAASVIIPAGISTHTTGLPLGGGSYAFKVRAIGNVYPNGIGDDRNWGEFSDVFRTEIDQPEMDNMNWQFARSFSEDGRTKEVVQYVDGLQGGKQSLAKISSSNDLIVSQSVMDDSRRAVISTLPSPVPFTGIPNVDGDVDQAFAYRSKFVTDENGDVFSANSFNGPVGTSAKMKLLGDYYSSDNSDLQIPSAEGYPYTCVVLSGDGTDRVVEQSGAGLTHSLDLQGRKTTKTFYGKVSSEELITIFGNEAPRADAVQKLVTIDPNGVASIAFIDKSGKTIATALVGETSADSNLEKLRSEPNDKGTIRIELDENIPIEGKLMMSYTLLLVEPSEVSLNYLFNSIGVYIQRNWGDNDRWCTDCQYKTVLRYTDKSTGITHDLDVPEAAGVDCGGKSIAHQETIPLEPGEYIFEKIMLPVNDFTDIKIAIGEDVDEDVFNQLDFETGSGRNVLESLYYTQTLDNGRKILGPKYGQEVPNIFRELLSNGATLVDQDGVLLEYDIQKLEDLELPEGVSPYVRVAFYGKVIDIPYIVCDPYVCSIESGQLPDFQRQMTMRWEDRGDKVEDYEVMDFNNYFWRDGKTLIEPISPGEYSLQIRADLIRDFAVQINGQDVRIGTPNRWNTLRQVAQKLERYLEFHTDYTVEVVTDEVNIGRFNRRNGNLPFIDIHITRKRADSEEISFGMPSGTGFNELRTFFSTSQDLSIEVVNLNATTEVIEPRWFDKLVANMIANGYDCVELQEVWAGLVENFENMAYDIEDPDPLVEGDEIRKRRENFDLLSTFLTQAVSFRKGVEVPEVICPLPSGENPLEALISDVQLQVDDADNWQIPDFIGVKNSRYGDYGYLEKAHLYFNYTPDECDICEDWIDETGHNVLGYSGWSQADKTQFYFMVRNSNNYKVENSDLPAVCFQDPSSDACQVEMIEGVVDQCEEGCHNRRGEYISYLEDKFMSINPGIELPESEINCAADQIVAECVEKCDYDLTDATNLLNWAQSTDEEIIESYNSLVDEFKYRQKMLVYDFDIEADFLGNTTPPDDEAFHLVEFNKNITSSLGNRTFRDRPQNNTLWATVGSANYLGSFSDVNPVLGNPAHGISNVECNCYSVSSSTAEEVGAIWMPTPLDLNERFEHTFNVYFGSESASSNGFAIVIQQQDNFLAHEVEAHYAMGSHDGSGVLGEVPILGRFSAVEITPNPSAHLIFSGDPISEGGYGYASSTLFNGEYHEVSVIFDNKEEEFTVSIDNVLVGVISNTYFRNSDLGLMRENGEPVYLGFTSASNTNVVNGGVDHTVVCHYLNDTPWLTEGVVEGFSTSCSGLPNQACAQPMEGRDNCFELAEGGKSFRELGQIGFENRMSFDRDFDLEFSFWVDIEEDQTNNATEDQGGAIIFKFIDESIPNEPQEVRLAILDFRDHGANDPLNWHHNQSYVDGDSAGVLYSEFSLTPKWYEDGKEHTVRMLWEANEGLEMFIDGNSFVIQNFEWNKLIDNGYLNTDDLKFEISATSEDDGNETSLKTYVCHFMVNQPEHCGNVYLRWNNPTLVMCDEYAVDAAPWTCNQESADAIRNAFEEASVRFQNEEFALLEENYKSTCLESDTHEKLTLEYGQRIHHYTLFYYDRAGNLIQTVPPEGVRLQPASSGRQHVSTHEMTTDYQYNSLGQLVMQHSPDGGITKYRHDNLGRVRFSQNAQQRADGKFAYTNYDDLGRIVESGVELMSGNQSFEGLDVSKSHVSYLVKDLLVKTYYSRVFSAIKYVGQVQKHTHNRISRITRQENGAKTSDLYFSYDVHGNVAWMAQHVNNPVERYNFVRYDYDLISGNVNKVFINENRADQFLYKYTYDADNRIETANSSKDGKVWSQDARYIYYAHGPVKRVELGENKIQGLDFTYTINGWLKAINSPDLNPTLDPGNDGLGSGFGKDAFGMALHYFNGDFNHEVSGSKRKTNPLSNLEMITNHQLYNGNIGAWTSNITRGIDGEVTAGEGSFTSHYSYDVLNRLIAADQTVRDEAAGADNGWAKVNEYSSLYQYDANGNLEYLYRNDGSHADDLHDLPAENRAVLDDFRYQYQGEGNAQGGITHVIGVEGNGIPALKKHNRLMRVVERASTNAGANDIKAGTYDFEYDELGNLTHDDLEDLDISWNHDGKVNSVVKGDGTTIDFSYDPFGNRVSKEVTRNGIVDLTHYFRDASGQTLATYECNYGDDATESEIASQDLTIEYPLYGSSRLGAFRETGVSMDDFSMASLTDMNVGQTVYSEPVTPLVAFHGQPEGALLVRQPLNRNKNQSLRFQNERTKYVRNGDSHYGYSFTAHTDENDALFHMLTTRDANDNIQIEFFDNHSRHLDNLISANPIDKLSPKSRIVAFDDFSGNDLYTIISVSESGYLLKGEFNAKSERFVDLTSVICGEVITKLAPITITGLPAEDIIPSFMALRSDGLNGETQIYVVTSANSSGNQNIYRIQFIPGQVPQAYFELAIPTGHKVSDLFIAPNGQYLGYRSTRRGNRVLRVYPIAEDGNVGTTKVVNKSNLITNYGAAFSASGKYLWYDSNGLNRRLTRLDLETGATVSFKDVHTLALTRTARGLVLYGIDENQDSRPFEYTIRNEEGEEPTWKFPSDLSSETYNWYANVQGFLSYQATTTAQIASKKVHELTISKPTEGSRVYEVTDHLGNVRAVLSDQQIGDGHGFISNSDPFEVAHISRVRYADEQIPTYGDANDPYLLKLFNNNGNYGTPYGGRCWGPSNKINVQPGDNVQARVNSYYTTVPDNVNHSAGLLIISLHNADGTNVQTLVNSQWKDVYHKSHAQDAGLPHEWNEASLEYTVPSFSNLHNYKGGDLYVRVQAWNPNPNPWYIDDLSYEVIPGDWQGEVVNNTFDEVNDFEGWMSKGSPIGPSVRSSITQPHGYAMRVENVFQYGGATREFETVPGHTYVFSVKIIDMDANYPNRHWNFVASDGVIGQWPTQELAFGAREKYDGIGKTVKVYFQAISEVSKVSCYADGADAGYITIDDVVLTEIVGQQAEVASYYNYYPFGMVMADRSYSSEDYRYGFGGQENDDEIAGAGNSMTAEFWQYDTRLGRRWNLDPLESEYPGQSPFVVFNNNPIYYNDPLGLEGDPAPGKVEVKGVGLFTKIFNLKGYRKARRWAKTFNGTNNQYGVTLYFDKALPAHIDEEGNVIKNSAEYWRVVSTRMVDSEEQKTRIEIKQVAYSDDFTYGFGQIKYEWQKVEVSLKEGQLVNKEVRMKVKIKETGWGWNFGTPAGKNGNIFVSWRWSKTGEDLDWNIAGRKRPISIERLVPSSAKREKIQQRRIDRNARLGKRIRADGQPLRPGDRRHKRENGFIPFIEFGNNVRGVRKR